MLVLTRGPGQSIIIGDNIEVTVVSRRGNKVQIGIKAPLEVSVRRAEVVPSVPPSVAPSAQPPVLQPVPPFNSRAAIEGGATSQPKREAS